MKFRRQYQRYWTLGRLPNMTQFRWGCHFITTFLDAKICTKWGNKPPKYDANSLDFSRFNNFKLKINFKIKTWLVFISALIRPSCGGGINTQLMCPTEHQLIDELPVIKLSQSSILSHEEWNLGWISRWCINWIPIWVIFGTIT